MATFSISAELEPMLEKQTNKSKFVNQLLMKEKERQEAEFGEGNFQDCTQKEGPIVPSQPELSRFVKQIVEGLKGDTINIQDLYKQVRDNFFDGDGNISVDGGTYEFSDENERELALKTLEKNIRFALLSLKQLGMVDQKRRGEYFWLEATK